MCNKLRKLIHIFLCFRMAANFIDHSDEAMEVDPSPCPDYDACAEPVPMEVDDLYPSSTTNSCNVTIKKKKSVSFNSTVKVASYNALAATCRGCKIQKSKTTDFEPKTELVPIRRRITLIPKPSSTAPRPKASRT